MTCFVYVIAHSKTDDALGLPVKIGVASNLKARVRTLQTGNPEAIQVFASFAFPTKTRAHQIERTVREALDDFNLTGREWFWIEPAVAAATIERALKVRPSR